MEVGRRPHTRKRTDSGRSSRRGVYQGATGNMVPFPQRMLSRKGPARQLLLLLRKYLRCWLGLLHVYGVAEGLQTFDVIGP